MATQVQLEIGHYCYYVFETMCEEGKGFRPVVIVEGEPGYHMQGGDGPMDSLPWYWGHDFKKAQEICSKQNERLGLTPQDVDRIVASSFR